VQFANDATEDIWDGIDSRAARRALPSNLHSLARRRLFAINTATRLADLGFPPGNGLEALAGARNGQHSIRINDRYRVCFRWNNEGCTEVEIVDYH
jgi:proteic killer suppression protein